MAARQFTDREIEQIDSALAAYFMDVAKRKYLGGPGAAAIPEKVGFVSSFVSSLA